MRLRTSRGLVAAVAVAAMVTTACGGSGGGGSAGGGGGGGGTIHPKDGTAGTPGGTLYIPMTADFEHLDPARNYIFTQLDMGRILYRTLTTYKAKPGTAGQQVVGDLATDTGKPSDGAKTWTFTLKDGLKYEDGSAITSKDVKYGIERAFDPDLPEGPQYIQADLANVPKGYQGPKKSGTELPASSIDTPNDKTIVFHLSKAVGDFSYLASEPTFAPVPRAKDTGVKYDDHVFSSGPYKIQTYNRGKNMTLVRNTYWSRKTDTVRGAYPDKMVLTFGLDASVLDQKFITDSGNDQSAIMFDSNVQPANVAKVLANAQIKKRSDSGLSGITTYFAINTRKITDLRVRQALNYAINRQTIRAAFGGETGGQYASTLSAPNVPGHQDLSDLYKSGDTGDPAKAKQLLAQAGKSNLSLTLGVPDSAQQVQVAVALQAAYKLAGIKVSIQQIPKAKYYDVIGNPKTEPDIMRSTWGADWPSMSTVIPPVFDGRQIRPQGNVNVSLTNNPAFDAEMDRIGAMTDVNAAAKAWGALERKILQTAPIVPAIYSAGILLHGSKVKGTFFHQYYGLYDLAAVSVTK